MDDFILNYGILAIASLLFIDDLGIPLPGSTIIFTSAILARTNDQICIFKIIFIALLIPPIANSILFYWGNHGARKWLKSYGHKILLPNKRLKKAEVFFEKYGEKTVFFTAIIPNVRVVTSVIAGSSNMNPLKFLGFHFAGILIWATIFIGSGYFLGESIWACLKENYRMVILFAFLLIFIKIIYEKFIKIIPKK